MIFDEVRKLKDKKHLTKMDKARFLAMVPDTTLSMNIEPSPSAVVNFYTDDDINELFEYWFSVFKGLESKEDYLWK